MSKWIVRKETSESAKNNNPKIEESSPNQSNKLNSSEKQPIKRQSTFSKLLRRESSEKKNSNWEIFKKLNLGIQAFNRKKDSPKKNNKENNDDDDEDFLQTKDDFSGSFKTPQKKISKENVDNELKK